MLQGLFLVFSAAVIVFNLIADLLYGYLDPRVRNGMSRRFPPPPGHLAAPPARAGRRMGDFRQHRPGMIGLVILALVVVMALAAPLLADESGCSAINTTENPAWASPSEFSPLGTDNFGRSV